MRIAAFLLMLLFALPVSAQQAAVPAQPNAVTASSMIARDVAVLQVLDKVSARTTKLRVPVGSAAAFGLIFITVRSCQVSPPSELPESAAFVEISEIDIHSLPRSGQIPVGLQPSRLLYTGWMFASSPALAALEHPIYDVSVIGCEARSVTPAERAANGEEGSAPAGSAAPETSGGGAAGASPEAPMPED